MKLFKIHEIQIGFLFCLTDRGMFKSFAVINKAAGQFVYYFFYWMPVLLYHNYITIFCKCNSTYG